MPNTPSGTRIWPTLMPLGRRLTLLISPTGSAMVAICSQPRATVSMTLGPSFRRSTIASARPLLRAACRSSSLAACSSGTAWRSRRARPVSAALRAAVDEAAIVVAAARAAAPTWAM